MSDNSEVLQYKQLRTAKFSTIESLYNATGISMQRLSNFEENKTKPLITEFAKLVVAFGLENQEDVLRLSKSLDVDYGNHDFVKISEITWSKITALAMDGRRIPSIGIVLLPKEKSYDAKQIIEEVAYLSGKSISSLNKMIDDARNKLSTAHQNSSEVDEQDDNSKYPKKTQVEYVKDFAQFMYEEEIADYYKLTVNKLNKLLEGENITLLSRKQREVLPIKELHNNVIRLLRTGRSLDNISRKLDLTVEQLVMRLSMNTTSSKERDELLGKGIKLQNEDTLVAERYRYVILHGGDLNDLMIDLQTSYNRVHRLLYAYSGVYEHDFAVRVHNGQPINKDIVASSSVEPVSEESTDKSKAPSVLSEKVIPMERPTKSAANKASTNAKRKRTVQKHIRPAFEHGETEVANLKRFFAENPQMNEMDRMNYALASELFTDFSEIGKPLHMPEGLVKLVLTREDKSDFYYEKIQTYLYNVAAVRNFDMAHLQKYN